MLLATGQVCPTAHDGSTTVPEAAHGRAWIPPNRLPASGFGVWVASAVQPSGERPWVVAASVCLGSVARGRRRGSGFDRLAPRTLGRSPFYTRATSFRAQRVRPRAGARRVLVGFPFRSACSVGGS